MSLPAHFPSQRTTDVVSHLLPFFFHSRSRPSLYLEREFHSISIVTTTAYRSDKAKPKEKGDAVKVQPTKEVDSTTTTLSAMNGFHEEAMTTAIAELSSAVTPSVEGDVEHVSLLQDLSAEETYHALPSVELLDLPVDVDMNDVGANGEDLFHHL